MRQRGMPLPRRKGAQIPRFRDPRRKELNVNPSERPGRDSRKMLGAMGAS